MLEPESSEREFDYESHWISEQCERGLPLVSTGPLLTGIVTFGLVWDVVWLVYVVTRWEHLDVPFLVGWALALLWVNLAPFFIWTYDEVVLPQFFERFREITESEEDLRVIAKTYDEFFAKPRYLSSAFWALAVTSIAWAGTPVLQANGMAGSGEVFLWLVYAYGVYIGGVLGGPGFMGPVTTMLVIREIASLEFEIQPLHPDQLGGLSNVGYYAIRTTLLFSTASLFLPLGFRLAAGEGRQAVIVTVFAVYILTILLSFVYPTLKINRSAERRRAEVLSELRERSLRLMEGTDGDGYDEFDDIRKQLEFQRIRSRYDDYRSVRLYPIQIDILFRLLGSVLLPIVMLVVEVYVVESFT